MSYIQYPATSPYTATPQLTWRIGRYEHRPIPASPSDEAFTITHVYAQRPDLLANERYGSPHYWWVFMLRNMNVIRDPIFDFNEGETIFVPTLQTIRAIYG